MVTPKKCVRILIPRPSERYRVCGKGFANMIKLGLSWFWIIWVGPKAIDKYPSKTTERTQTCREGGGRDWCDTALSKKGGSHQRLEKQQILPESLWRECSPDNSLILDFHPPTPKEQISIVLSRNTWCKLLWKHQKTNTRVFGSWLCMDSTSLWWKRLTCSPLLIPFEGNLVFYVSIYLRYLRSFTGLTRSFR